MYYPLNVRCHTVGLKQDIILIILVYHMTLDIISMCC